MKLLEKTHEYQDWFTGLSDKLVKARIQARIDRLQDGNAGDVAQVGEGVSELRLHFGSGWRVYYTELSVTGKLSSCWRGTKSSQARDIKLALKLAHNL
ncbi:MAG: type II toxin-antitoxin system RelE/ParE family toxin [Gallionella sp.]